MHTVIAPFSLRSMTIVEQANRLMQHAENLYEENENIIEPEGREVAKGKMSDAKGLKNKVRKRFWLAQTDEAKSYFRNAQEVLREVKSIVDEAIEIGSQNEGLRPLVRGTWGNVT